MTRHKIDGGEISHLVYERDKRKNAQIELYFKDKTILIFSQGFKQK